TDAEIDTLCIQIDQQLYALLLFPSDALSRGGGQPSTRDPTHSAIETATGEPAGHLWARFKGAAYAAASDVGEKTIRLYRAVGETELNDILRFGDYGFAPSGGGKYFAFTEEGTRRFAGSSINLGRRVTITSIEIPEWFLQRGTRFIDPGPQGAG